MGETGRLNGFVNHWGWINTVYEMAEFYRESRNEQYEKTIMEFYNDLAFMKDRCKYDNETLKEQMKVNANR